MYWWKQDKKIQKGELHSWQRLRWGRNRQKCFPSMYRNHSVFLRKSSKTKLYSWRLLFFHVYCVWLQNGKSWQHSFPMGPWIYTLTQLASTVHFSTMVILCSYLDSVDLERQQWKQTKSINILHTKKCS